MPPTSSRELIPHNARRVEVGADLEHDHEERFGLTASGPVRDDDGGAMLGGRLAGQNDGLAGMPFSDAHLPQVTGAGRCEHLGAPIEEDPHRADVALGTVRLTAVDRQLAAERVEGVRAEGEGAPRQNEGVQPVRDVKNPAHSVALGRKKPSIPHRGVRDENRSLQERQDVAGDALEPRGPGDLLGPYSVDMRGAADPFAGVDQRAEGTDGPSADDAVDAHLHHPVPRRVQTRHLEVDEGERGLRNGQVPGRSGRGWLHA